MTQIIIILTIALYIWLISIGIFYYWRAYRLYKKFKEEEKNYE